MAMPAPFNWSKAFSASWTVMPAPMTVARSWLDCFRPRLPARGMGLLELVGVGRIGHLRVQGHHLGQAKAQRRDGVAVSLAGRLLAAEAVRRQLERLRFAAGQQGLVLGLGGLDDQVPFAAQL